MRRRPHAVLFAATSANSALRSAPAVAFIVFSTASLAAAPSPLLSVQSLPAAAGTEVEALNADVRASFRISNSGASAAPVTITVRSTTRSGAQDCAATTCTLQWVLDGAVLAPEHPQTLTLAPYSAKELVYSGRAENLGIYYSEALVAQNGEAAIPVSIKITRSLPKLGDNPISVSPPGTRTLWSNADAPVTFALSSSTDQAIDVGKGLIAKIERQQGDQTYADFQRNLTVTCNNTTTLVIPARGQASCSADKLNVDAPGRYRADVSIINSAAPANAHADFTVRMPWFVAAIVILVGGGLGAFLAGYQNGGRQRALQAADLMDLRAKYRTIARSLDPQKSQAAAKIVSGVLDAISAALEDLRKNRNADHTDDLTNWGKRLPLLHRFASLEAAYQAGGAQAQWKQAYNDAKAAVEADVPPDNAQDKLTALKDSIATNLASSRVAGPAADDPQDFFFTWRPSATAGGLLEMVKRFDLAILIFSMLLATAIAVLTLWKTNPTWGNGNDFFIAFVTGAGLALTGALSIKQLLSGYKLGQVTP